jgi:predicted Co/Zn/Cd cation transporter (cation efflux family)
MARHAKKISYKMDPFALIGTVAIAILCLASLTTGLSPLLDASHGLDAENTIVVIVSMIVTAVIAVAGAALFIASRSPKRLVRKAA